VGFTFPFNNLTIEEFFPNGEGYAAIQRRRAACSGGWVQSNDCNHSKYTEALKQLIVSDTLTDWGDKVDSGIGLSMVYVLEST
jgi:hypothetical protein